MLSIYILNVNQGDSIVLDYHGSDGRAFGVIDSCRPRKNDEAPALSKLKELGAKELSFVALTHPDSDHYLGLIDILKSYEGRIDSFYSFPVEKSKEKNLRKIGEILKQIIGKTDSINIATSMKELAEILYFAEYKIGLDNWREPEGEYYLLRPLGFAGVELAGIMPPKRVKTFLNNTLQKGSTELIDRKTSNDLSLAFSLKYKGKTIVLGGDSTVDNWRFRKRIWSKHENDVGGMAVKMPHHGSKIDCAPAVIEYLFASEGERWGVISSDGRRTHPHPIVLSDLYEKGISPYCTNLAKECGYKRTNLQFYSNEIEPSLMRYANSIIDKDSMNTVNPCQGEILIELLDNGEMNLKTEFDHPCKYRGGYDFLFDGD